MSTALSFWQQCVTLFEAELAPQQFGLWIKPINAEDQNGNLILFCTNPFSLKWVKDHYSEKIQSLAETLGFDNLTIEYQIYGKQRKSENDINSTPINLDTELQGVSSPPLIKRLTATQEFDDPSKLNPELNFDNLVVGKANQLARAASQQVAENPGKTYNPLFIYGSTGLGKTHLIQAIGNAVRKNNPTAKIRYIHSETYVSEIVRAYKDQTWDEFKRYYRSLDLLLLDDIQFFTGRKGTQEDFFHLYNTLTENSKQIIVTSDHYPKELKGFETRLISRFSWGLTVEVEPPDLEMRVAILINKSMRMGLELDEHVAFFVAKQIRTNVRELEGALTKIKAFTDFHGIKLTLQAAKDALKDLLAVQNRQISIENIVKTTADFFKIKTAEMYSKKRTRAIARPRQMAMALTKELTDLSLPEIGAHFGGRDHTTVIHACKQIKKLRDEDPRINDEFVFILQILRN